LSEYTGTTKYRLATIDSIQDQRKRWETLITGVLIGNFFDWGAKEVTQERTSTKNF